MFGQKNKRKNAPIKFSFGNNKRQRRLNWKQMEPQEGCNVVKGLSRRVIVIKSPDARYFDEAIFVLKDEIFGGKDSSAIIKEARKVANSYVKVNPKAPKKSGLRFPPGMFVYAGTFGTAAVFLGTLVCVL